MFSRTMAILVLIVFTAPLGSAPKDDDAVLLEGRWVSTTYENNQGARGPRASGSWSSRVGKWG